MVRSINAIMSDYFNGKPVVFANIGDSHTWGQIAIHWDDTGMTPDNPIMRSFMNQLRDNLTSKNPNSKLYNHGIGGYTAQKHIDANTVGAVIGHGDVNLCMITLGVNDANGYSGGNTSLAPANYKANLQTMITQLNNAGIAVVLVKQEAIIDKLSALPPTNSGYMLHYDFHSKIDELVNENPGVGVIDIWTPFNDAFEKYGAQGSGLNNYPDGTFSPYHPGQTGHDLYFQTIHNYMISIQPQLTAQTTCNIVDIPYLTAQTTCSIVSNSTQPLEVTASTLGSAAVSANITIHPSQALAVKASTKGQGQVSANITIHPAKWLRVSANTTGHSTVSANVTIGKTVVPVGVSAEVSGSASVSADVTIKVAVAVPVSPVNVMGQGTISAVIAIHGRAKHKGPKYKWKPGKDRYQWKGMDDVNFFVGESKPAWGTVSVDDTDFPNWQFAAQNPRYKFVRCDGTTEEGEAQMEVQADGSIMLWMQLAPTVIGNYQHVYFFVDLVPADSNFEMDNRIFDLEVNVKQAA